ncbi:4-(cytidine 5'-diphospho)-2-C-methyl-D-erythritol kinase [Liquorilactobacillus uvarum]|uniref:4-diphosphocytidyl-2-C-methyl-D-erythritol kinase n=1 Tax=Liquorilactobacillus uvarum DSM 19971 TaxID=1423812 RepID=A0A0R1PYV7_9LACO|nr:4-(cytidine 5'-diphospho)-2-C-methyl-D-erythritol kinase [Liquorilactobacillus uvarum]KRL37686.1 4-diphosphocytidyl-2-C-methyl-D-erythritol kinase [Liquorilactobacillus uvarum DSM 19971]
MDILEKAPAKINLCLDTPFRHLDGSPEWRMVMTSIDLSDYVHIETSSALTGISIETDTGFLPSDHRNLAYKAAKELQCLFNISEGVHINIKKNIPVAAGLGGGSSDAAAVLRGLNQVWNLKLSLCELAKIGLKIDSDVPFCVYSKTALVEGKGELITPLDELPPFWLVVAKPHESVSTPSILKKISYEKIEHPNVDNVVAGIKKGNLAEICKWMGNALEPITVKEISEINKIKQKMYDFGVQAAQMSGSGPTVFGVCAKYSRAQHVYNSLKGFCNEVYIVHPCSLEKSFEHR